MTRYRVSATDIRIHKVLSKIEQDPATTVEELAQMVNLSSSRLGHLFKLQAGEELRHFLVDARLDKAAGFLRDTDMQIKEISSCVGYQHVPSFDRVFRRKFRLSPLNYRKQQSQSGARNPVVVTVPTNGNHIASEKG
jgi:transcriptional regulator GlxA family with amidase domain